MSVNSPWASDCFVVVYSCAHQRHRTASENADKLLAGISRYWWAALEKAKGGNRKGSTPTTEKAECTRDCKLKMVFPQQKHSQRESGQWESSTTHLPCRWLNDVPECSLAALWPSCGVLLKVSHPQCYFHFHTHTCICWLRCVEGIWWWKCVCVVVVKVAVSFRCTLIIHVACGCLIEMNILLLLITAIARVM